ncbi:unnamed protein product [Orchesella dallaii]|uniref:Uncharacterized protein n=1 Tax=Orchesella dallaii TaxID=48710 RepID=A0ABP1S8N4_9HEXA
MAIKLLVSPIPVIIILFVWTINLAGTQPESITSSNNPVEQFKNPKVVVGLVDLLEKISGSCHIHIISQDVHYDLAGNSKNTITTRNFRTRQSLIDSSPSTSFDSAYYTENCFVDIDFEDFWQSLNPIRMRHASQDPCMLSILLFSFETLGLKKTDRENVTTPTIYLPYLRALKELERYFLFKNRALTLPIQPAERFIVHISLSSPSDDSVWKFIDFFRRYHSVNNGVIQCKPNQPGFYVNLSSNCLEMQYFCSTCSTPNKVHISLQNFLWNDSNFGKLPYKFSPLNQWTIKYSDYSRNQNLVDYQNSKNIFLPPRNNSLVFRFAIVQLLVSSSNVSLYLNIEDENKLYPKMYVEKQLSRDYTFTFYLYDPRLNQYWLTVFVSRTEYTFFTCYTEDHLTISYYFQPFQQALWIALLTCLTILAVLTHLLLILKGFNKPDFNAYFFAYSSFLEHSYHIPDYLFDFVSTRITLGLWLLISVIFTNAYKGIAITGVTAPPEKSSVNTFSELVNDLADNGEKDDAKHGFQIFSPMLLMYLDDWMDDTLYQVNFTGVTGAAVAFVSTIFSYVVDLSDEIPLIWKMNGGLLKLYSVNATPQQKLALQKSTLYAKLQDDRNYLVPKKDEDPRYSMSYSIAVERELVQCHKRVVYIDHVDKVDREMEFLSNYYHYKNFFKSNETMLSDFKVWQFDNGHGSKLPAVFKILIESGIYRQIEYFYRRQDFLGIRLEYTRNQSQEEEFMPVKKLDLKSNVQTVFYLYFIGIFVVVGIICVEFMYYWLRSYLRSKHVRKLTVDKVNVKHVCKAKIFVRKWERNKSAEVARYVRKGYRMLQDVLLEIIFAALKKIRGK